MPLRICNCKSKICFYEAVFILKITFINLLTNSSRLIGITDRMTKRNKIIIMSNKALTAFFVDSKIVMFIVIIIVLNLIFGVIIDTFADLRSEKQKKEEILKTTCFICGRKSMDKCMFLLQPDNVSACLREKNQISINPVMAKLNLMNIITPVFSVT